MEIDKITWDKIDKFFDSESTQSSMKYVSQQIKKTIDDSTQETIDRLSEFLCDEFRLQYKELVRVGIVCAVKQMLSGDLKVLEEYNLAPADWGLRCDSSGIRRKIVEDNADIIRNTYIKSLEEELKRAREMLITARSCT